MGNQIKSILLMKAHCLIIVLASTFLSSCLGPFDDVQAVPINDNAEFYGTEWSTSSLKEGLKFYDDDTVLDFCEGYRGKGTFKYNKSTGLIVFTDLEVFFSSWTSVTTSAYLQEDGSLKVYWHVLGESDGYYKILYKRR